MRPTLVHSTIAPRTPNLGVVWIGQPQHFVMQSRRNEGGEKRELKEAAKELSCLSDCCWKRYRWLNKTQMLRMGRVKNDPGGPLPATPETVKSAFLEERVNSTPEGYLVLCSLVIIWPGAEPGQFWREPERLIWTQQRPALLASAETADLAAA